MLNCISCSKLKGDYDVWSNKIVIGATFNSDFQDDEIIRSMDEKSVLCHQCVQMILDKITENKK
jgi:hypothetical protein